MPDEKILNGKPTLFKKDLERFLPEGRSLGDLPTELVDELQGLQFAQGEIISERFEMIEQLGFGGMGAVYKVKDLLMRGQLKALKIMLPSLVRSNEARERFISEAEIAQSLRHEGIATVYDIGRHGDILFLTMELLEGQSLDRFLKSKSGRLGLLEAVDIILKICEGLSYAHKKGVIHRDIKPQNIFVLPDRRVKLLDFGLAKLLSPGRLTRSSMGLGTAYYMSPEQSMGKGVDERSDIFSVGVVFHQMLIGRIPMGRFKLPSTLNPSIPSSIDSIIEKCLDELPGERYKDVESLVTEIKQVQSACEREEKERTERKKEALIEKKDEDERRKKKEEPISSGKEPRWDSFKKFNSLLNSLKGIEQEIRKELQGKTEKHPDIVGLVREKAELTDKITFVAKEATGFVLKRYTELSEERKELLELYKPNSQEIQKIDKELANILQFSADVVVYHKDTSLCKILGIEPIAGMEFIFIKGGTFQMGDNFGDGSDNEKPPHEVFLNDFYMGKFEVTQGQWKDVVGNNPSHFMLGSNYPVENVSWEDVKEFIRRLNEKAGKKYRLPTEAEWEYAARGGGKKEKWAGTSSESELEEYAWYEKNSGGKTHPVGQKRPNGLGLYDMSGNVWEWCHDWYDKNYYRNSPKSDPTGPTGSPIGNLRVLRGGSWSSSLRYVRAAYRHCMVPTLRKYFFGFRLVLPTKEFSDL